MVQLQGLQVTVAVDGQDLTEYINHEAEQDEDDEADSPRAGHYIERYIEAKTGSIYYLKHVAVSEEFKRNEPGISLNVVIDGVEIHHGWIRRSWPYEGNLRTKIYSKSGVNYEEPFVFGTIRTTDGTNLGESAQAKSKARALGLGTIEVKVRRAVSFSDSSNSLANDGNSAAQDHETIHEKLLKGRAVSHQTSYGEAKVTHRTFVDGVYKDTLDKPFLHFKFHYMSKTSLQIMGLIPRSPSPDETEDGTDIRLKNMTREQLLELANRQQAEIMKHQKLKREATAGPSVKREQLQDDDPDLSVVSSRNVRAKRSAPITIDLTDD